MTKIHFTYRHIDKPWGGANNFIRALRDDLLQNGRFTVTDSIEDDCDILFMNQLGTGPGGEGKLMPISLVRRLVGTTGKEKRMRRLVVRAVNLNRHAFPLGVRNLTVGWWRDHQAIALLNMADVAIFQSAYQREFFTHAGYRGGNDVVIHNGAAPAFWLKSPLHPPLEGPLRLVSSTASPRVTKRHDLIARISLLDRVEVTHFGAWPQGLDPNRVRLLGMQAKEKMIEVMSDCHYFLHPAVKDPCPNSIFEAVCAGLPVMFNPGPGSSSEILGHCGLALDEDDFVKTVATARRELPALRSNVLDGRYRFTVSHAASRYRSVFEGITL